MDSDHRAKSPFNFGPAIIANAKANEVIDLIAQVMVKTSAFSSQEYSDNNA